ncbi:ribosomal protein L1/ribosomal biogenesis protein [Mycotypha africana]|uniref:ribosomal protein L1/ribosomal biogenesis protein n=1 Tax=Mycotypha africana TaxID=64632 RepID=UPI002301D629|nr:ribosomal protein L1/ribosomal biogenesis protein [Mycotypha africana]KAI8971429.1 ribosomal protein L1/ribosomal biogenesis protein [Mycotypha africana]
MNPLDSTLKHGCHPPGIHRCLFTKRSQQKHKEAIMEKKIKGIHKVIDLKHLKKQYSSPDAKQKLMDDFEMFMAEKSIITDLYKVLGKDVYKKRREPIPIDVYHPDFQKEVLRTAKSTYMNFHTGSCYAIRIASTRQTDTIAFENFTSAYQKIIAVIPGGEDNIRSLQIKTANSTSLPLYDAEVDYIEEGLNEEEEEEEE